jgi:hypothetical protein
MGAEAPCTLAVDGVGGKKAAGKALLETEELVFRSPSLRLVVKLTAITSLRAEGGVLHVGWDGRTAAFELGPAAVKWLEKIKNPKSRAEKLGIKPGQRVALVGGSDASLVAEIEARGAAVAALAAGTDIIFCFAEARAALGKLAALAKKLKKDGAIWVIRPKGAEAITEKDVLSAGRASGLVDVKVAAFSATHTALKLVVPVAKRARA